MAKQTVQGKGFEYACLQTFYKLLKEARMSVVIEETKPYLTAQEQFSKLDKKLQESMLQAAKASVRTIIKSEPNLSHGTETIRLMLLEDKKGGEGDVRDLVFLKGETGWEIGVSCKHNHHALKHSRLSKHIDFGEKWLGHPVSVDYFQAVVPIFEGLEQLRNETKHLDKSEQNKWDKVGDKDQNIYRPILDAFRQELIHLSEKHADVPQKLVEYLLGRKDFYKVIAEDKEKKTIIQAFNLHDSLSLNYGKQKAISRIKSFQNILPSQIYSFDYKKNSNNTLILVMDNGWTISFRIHSASSRIEPSLKFDIQLIGIPSAVTNIEEYWEE